jgi:TolA-binding protein
MAASKVKRRDLKEDKVYMTMADVADFFARHRFHIAIGVLGAVALFALVYFHNISAQQKAAEASVALYHAEEGEGSAGREALAKIPKDFPGTPAAATARYQLGNLLYEEGKYEEARQAFSEFLKRHPNHPAAPAAMEAVGYCDESLGQWRDAANQYENLKRRYPDKVVSKRVTYRIGLCYEHLGETQKALDSFRETIGLMPDSLWAEYAQERLASLSPEPSAPAVPAKTE